MTSNGEILRSERAGDQRFRKVFDEGPLGMGITDIGRRFVEVNPAFCAMLGYSASELLSMRVDDITHPDDLGMGLDMLQQLWRGEVSRYQHEKRYFRKDRSVLPVMLHASVLRSDSGQPELVLGMVEDITARKQTEKALQDSQLKLSLALDAIGGALSHWNSRTGETLWNQRCYEILGFEHGSVTPGPDAWRSRIHPEDRARVESEFQQSINQHQQSTTEYRLLLPDGSTRWVRTSRRFEHDAEGPVSCTSVAYDITRAKQAELELREGHDRLMLAIEVAKIGTAIWNLQDGHLQWNARTFEILGHRPYSFVPNYQCWRNQVHPDDIAQTEAQFWRAANEHLDYSQEHRIVRPDGEIRWVRLMARVSHDPGGRPTYSTAVTIDITERKELEQQVRDAQAAVSANPGKAQALAAIGEQLRTSLAPIATATQMLEKETALSAQQWDLLRLIKQNVGLQQKLIDDLLSQSAAPSPSDT